MPRKKKDLKVRVVKTYVSERQFEVLQLRAEENDRSLAAELRLAIRQHLKEAA